jgi:hypothetical protein
MQAWVESAAALEVVLEAVSLWAAAKPRRATMGRKACMVFVCV